LNSIDCGLYVIKNVEIIYSRFFYPCSFPTSNANRSTLAGHGYRRSNESKILSIIRAVVNNPTPYDTTGINQERKNIANLIQRYITYSIPFRMVLLFHPLVIAD